MAARAFALSLFFYSLLSIGDANAQFSNQAAASSWDFGGEYEIKLDFRKNFALDPPNKDDLLRLDQELQLRSSYRYKDWISVLMEGKVFGEHQLYTGGGARRSEVDLERGETWIRFDKLFGRDLSLKLGRQNFDEPRKWWWDDDLDAVGLRYGAGPWRLEFAVSQEFVPVSLLDKSVEPENKGVTRALARVNWRYFESHFLDLFFLHQNDKSATQSVGTPVQLSREDPSDARLWWSGLRASGKQMAGRFGELAYWVDIAILTGNEKLLEYSEPVEKNALVTSRTKQRVRGWALDMGGRWASELPAQPVFILGYAIGSGDKNPNNGTDRAFQQTGLQSNDEQFRTYGELLRPELSNLSVPLLAVQLPIFWRSHIEFAYRHFRQIYAAPLVRDGRIEADPDGLHKNIGQEWMLYCLLKEWKNVEIELVGAAFRSGHAYGSLSGKVAYSFFTQVTWEF